MVLDEKSIVTIIEVYPSGTLKKILRTIKLIPIIKEMADSMSPPYVINFSGTTV
jgi:hypothetical protein